MGTVVQLNTYRMNKNDQVYRHYVNNVIQFPVPDKKRNVPKNYKVGESTEVYPFKDPNDIERMKNYFLSKGQYRNYLLFVFGINVGLRCSDLVSLRWKDILYYEDGELMVERKVRIQEKKTRRFKKFRDIYPNQSIRDAIDLYIEKTGNVNLEDYIFTSRKGGALLVRSVQEIMKDASKEIGIRYNVGSHSLRKTFGYHQLMAHKGDAMFLSSLQKMFGHSSPETTLRYCGIESDDFEKYYNEVCL